MCLKAISCYLKPVVSVTAAFGDFGDYIDGSASVSRRDSGKIILRPGCKADKIFRETLALDAYLLKGQKTRAKVDDLEDFGLTYALKKKKRLGPKAKWALKHRLAKRFAQAARLGDDDELLVIGLEANARARGRQLAAAGPVTLKKTIGLTMPDALGSGSGLGSRSSALAFLRDCEGYLDKKTAGIKAKTLEATAAFSALVGHAKKKLAEWREPPDESQASAS